MCEDKDIRLFFVKEIKHFQVRINLGHFVKNT